MSRSWVVIVVRVANGVKVAPVGIFPNDKAAEGWAERQRATALPDNDYIVSEVVSPGEVQRQVDIRLSRPGHKHPLRGGRPWPA